MPEISSASFSTTDASNNSASPNGFPESMAPSGVNDSARAVMGAIKRFWSRIQGATAAGGSSNAFTLTESLSAYVTGERYSFRANHTITGSATLNINSLGAKTIKKMGSSGLADLASGDIQNGQPVTCEYDGTYLVMVTPVAADAAIAQGLHTIWVPAGAMVTRSTNGAAAGTTELSSNKVMLKTFDFDASTQEHVQFQVAMPKSWNESTVTAVFHWTAASGSGNVIWGLQGLATSDDDAMDAAFGTAQEVTDTLLTANDNHRTSATSAITIAGTPAAEDLVIFQVYRKAASASDTLAVDAKLLGVKLFITIDAATDT
ncbi:MAG TPA: hypothetical protein VEA44_14705 [Caulobacter sp.]|nr:hypothetical protein [Caulobacter sp.]